MGSTKQLQDYFYNLMKEKISLQVDFIICILFVLLTVSAYRHLESNEFLFFDDDMYITENQHLRQGVTVDSIGWAFKSFYLSYWHPLTWISHMMDYQLFGFDPAKHHLVNLSFHVLNTLLLFAALRTTTGAALRSAIVASLFALHPLNVESVAWVSERKTVLSAFFFMAAILAYVYYARKPALTKYLLVAIVFTLSLLSKPALVTFPFIMLLLDYWPLSRFAFSSSYPFSPEYGKIQRRFSAQQIPFLVYEKLPLMLISGISVYISYFSASHLHKVVNTSAVSISLRIMNAAVSYVKYIIKTLWPSHLAVYYPFPKEIAVWQAIAAGLFLLGATFLSLKNSKTKPYVTVGWFWFSGALVPFLGIIQAGAWPAMADRFMYIPMIGILIIMVWGFHDLIKKFYLGSVTACLCILTVLILFMFYTAQQVGLWRNGVPLFENALSIAGDNWYIYKNLGISYHHKGQLDHAGICYQKALSMKPDSAELHNNLGVVFLAKGEFKKAISYFQTSIHLDPDCESAYFNLGNALVKIGEMKNAESSFRKAIDLKPDYASAYFNLAGLLSDLGRYEQSLLFYHEYLKMRPRDDEAYYNMGDILITQGKTKEAIGYFIKAAQITSDFSNAYHHVGELFVLRGQKGKACSFFYEAIRIDPQNMQAKKSIEQYCK
jgi:protein O-mannosyl-transferase